MHYIKVNSSLLTAISDVLYEHVIPHTAHEVIANGIIITESDLALELIKNFFGDNAVISFDKQEQQLIEIWNMAEQSYKHGSYACRL